MSESSDFDSPSWFTSSSNDCGFRGVAVSSAFSMDSSTSLDLEAETRFEAGADGESSRSRSRKKKGKRRSQSRSRRASASKSVQPVMITESSRKRFNWCANLSVLVQALILCAIIIACVVAYNNVHTSIQYGAYVSAGVQAQLWLVLLICCLISSSTGLWLGFIDLLLTGVAELTFTVVGTVLNMQKDCEKEVNSCNMLIRGEYQHRIIFLTVHAVLGVIHLAFTFAFGYEVMKPRRTKRSIIVQSQTAASGERRRSSRSKSQSRSAKSSKSRRSAKSSKKSRSSKSSKKSSRSVAKSQKRSNSRSGSKSKSGKQSRASKDRSRVSRRSRTSRCTQATSSMQSYHPPPHQFQLQQQLQQPQYQFPPSHYTPSVASVCTTQCPIAHSHCNVHACPYYRQQVQAPPQPLVPAIRQHVDNNGALVIDLPQNQQTVDHGNGYVDIQRIVVKIPQQQRPQPAIQPASSQQSFQSMPQSEDQRVFCTTVTPMRKK